MRVLGIDEAGRGCVLGSLVIGGFLIEDVADEVLRNAGAADSKTMTHEKRVVARKQLAALGKSDVRLITPEEIDNGNLNQLEETVIVDLVRTWKPDLVLIDALGHPTGIPKVLARLQHRVGVEIRPKWTMEPKADGTYPVVGAASIFAKTTRDGLLDDVRDTYGDFGSGYPSDPKTRNWITTWAKTRRPWPPIVRTRWQTITNLAQQALF